MCTAPSRLPTGDIPRPRRCSSDLTTCCFRSGHGSQKRVPRVHVSPKSPLTSRRARKVFAGTCLSQFLSPAVTWRHGHQLAAPSFPGAVMMSCRHASHGLWSTHLCTAPRCLSRPQAPSPSLFSELSQGSQSIHPLMEMARTVMSTDVQDPHLPPMLRGPHYWGSRTFHHRVKGF